MPGDRPDDRRRARRERDRPSAFEDARPQIETTRRLLAERRAQARRDEAGRSGRVGDRGGGGGRRPRAPRRGRGPDDPGRKEVFRRRRIAAAVAAGVVLVGLWLLVSLFQPFKGEGQGEVGVTVPSGSGIGEIGDLLEREGVVSSSLFFELRARLAGSGEELKSGTFTLAEDMSYVAALEALAAAPAPTDVLSVTVPEGRARSEVAPIVDDAGLEGDYQKATKSSNELDVADYGAEDAETLEGFLFPSTYELKRNASAEDLVEKQLETFQQEFEKVDLSAAEEANLTPYDVLIVASMVEREAMIPEERPLVASVIYNRLREGIPLGIDATTRFELDNWTEPLVESDFEADTPYNTRLNTGLPPGPIGSPGRDSMEAAANPEESDFLYYVVKPGTCGEHVFTETDAEFQVAVDEYNAAREAAGFQSPTDCPE